MSEDMSDMMQKIGAMLNSGNMPDNIKQAMNNLKDSSDASKSSDSSSKDSAPQINPEMIQNMMKMFSSSKENDGGSKQENNSSSDNPIDFETIMKMKTVFEKMNSNKKDDPTSNLLLSLKPYLKKSRKEKVDQYVKLLNMGKMIEIFKPDGGDQNHDV